MGLLDAFRDKQFWSDVADNTAQLGKAASDAVASNVTGPVDMAAWALRKAGLPIPAAPVGGSDWAKSMGLLNGPQPTQSAQIAGETLGLLAPTMIAAKAPQIAKGLLSLDDKAMDMGRIAIENHMVKNGMIQPATVWHGSPHKFDKFDSSKIGTGEGAQAYGHGLYLAENPTVATEYSKMNPAGMQTPLRAFRGAELTAGTPEYHAATLVEGMGLPQARKAVSGWIDGARPEMAREAEGWKKTLDLLNSATSKSDFKVLKNTGSLYKVDLPDEHIAKMLDWDKPMTMQSDLYKKVAKEKELPYRGNTPKGGMDIYNSLVDQFGSQQAATEFLQKQGIPGIRYLDGGSRGAGSGTSNFVVFPGNEGLLQILERNGKKVGMALFDTTNLPNRGRELIQSKAENLAQQLKDGGFSVEVQHSGSAAGPSSYLKVYDPQTGRYFDNVRISGHSKGAFNTQGVVNVASDEEMASVLKGAMDMRNMGKASGMAFQEQLEKTAQEMIASGMKPRSAYNKAREMLSDSGKKIGE